MPLTKTSPEENGFPTVALSSTRACFGTVANALFEFAWANSGNANAMTIDMHLTIFTIFNFTLYVFNFKLKKIPRCRSTESPEPVVPK